MNNTLLLPLLQFSGFYELDTEGTILYSRIKRDGKFEKANSLPAGRNFFDDVFGCRNVEVLRRRFNSFVNGSLTTEKFIFSCFVSENIIPLKIMFVRVSETGGVNREGSILIDIRQT